MGRNQRAFTLVELLVVITIIGMFVTLMVPAVLSVRETARKAQCSSQLHNLILAMTSYESLNRTFPPGRVGCDCDQVPQCKERDGTAITGDKRAGTSGFVMILPQLEENVLYKEFGGFKKGAVFPGNSAPPTSQSSPDCADSATKSWKTTTIAQAIASRPSIFICPTDKADPTYYSAGVSSYAMMMGTLGPSTFSQDPTSIKYKNDGAFMYRRAMGSKDVLDGMGNTIFLGETHSGSNTATVNRWAVARALTDSLRSSNNGINGSSYYEKDDSGLPLDGYAVYGSFGSLHKNGSNFAFGDGRVQFLLQDIDITTYRYLSTIAGQEKNVKIPD